MNSTEEVITEIENWIKDCGAGASRPKLLSKMAFIEFCGWIEEWMDQAIRDIGQEKLKDSSWVEKELIVNTFGFHYSKHFRPMVCRLIGEERTRVAEASFDQSSTMDIATLNSFLGDCWTKRCKLTHQDFPTHTQAQLKIDGPSWTKNKYKMMSKNLDLLKAEFLKVI